MPARKCLFVYQEIPLRFLFKEKALQALGFPRPAEPVLFQIIFLQF